MCHSLQWHLHLVCSYKEETRVWMEEECRRRLRTKLLEAVTDLQA